MVEITSEEHNKVKRMKRTEDSLRHLWDNIKCTNLNYRGPRRKRKKKGNEKIFETDYSWKFSQYGKGNSQSSPRGTNSPVQDKTKEKHAKTHTNQTNKY